MRTIVVILTALALSMPLAAANWSYRGSNEPDTIYDTPSFMYFDPDTNPSQSVNKLYFNGWARFLREGHYNANVGALGSRVQPPVAAMAAMLGYWKDCNNDGYVGFAESALIEYRVELLTATTGASICPPSTPMKGQAIYPHNDGTWVRELIWLGPTNGAMSSNPTNFYSTDTDVWADWGLPGGAATLVCPGGNQGVRSTGALLEFVDCNTYFRIARSLNDVEAQTGAPVGGWDPSNIDNSDSEANVDNPAFAPLYGPAEPEGHEDEGDYRGYSGGFLGRDADGENQRARLVTVVDCESNGPDASPSVNTPGDPLDPATYPSAYESGNDTYEVVTQSGDDRCAASGESDEGLPYNAVHPTEGYTEPQLPHAGRDSTDFIFTFNFGSRSTVPGGGTCRGGNNPAFAPHPALGYCPPADLGTSAERDDGPVGSAWRTNAQINTYTTTSREQLQGAEPDFGGYYFTFYARVGQTALDFGEEPNAVGNSYGSEACGANEGGIHGGWNCDPARWIVKCSEAESPLGEERCPTVGWQYHLRDVDCWDGTVVRGTGVHASLADTSASGACRENPANAQADVLAP